MKQTSAHGANSLVAFCPSCEGASQFTSTYDVKNTSGGTIYFRAMYAGDLYVGGDDYGAGVFEVGPPRFVGGQNTISGAVGGFQEAAGPARLDNAAAVEWDQLRTAGLAVGGEQAFKIINRG